MGLINDYLTIEFLRPCRVRSICMVANAIKQESITIKLVDGNVMCRVTMFTYFHYRWNVCNEPPVRRVCYAQ